MKMSFMEAFRELLKVAAFRGPSIKGPSRRSRPRQGTPLSLQRHVLSQADFDCLAKAEAKRTRRNQKRLSYA